MRGEVYAAQPRLYPVLSENGVAPRILLPAFTPHSRSTKSPTEMGKDADMDNRPRTIRNVQWQWTQRAWVCWVRWIKGRVHSFGCRMEDLLKTNKKHIYYAIYTLFCFCQTLAFFALG